MFKEYVLLNYFIGIRDISKKLFNKLLEKQNFGLYMYINYTELFKKHNKRFKK